MMHSSVTGGRRQYNC